MSCRDRLLLRYKKNRAEVSREITRLFTTTTKPYRKASNNTLSRWVKNILQKAGVNINISLTLLEALPKVWRDQYIFFWIQF